MAFKFSVVTTIVNASLFASVGLLAITSAVTGPVPVAPPALAFSGPIPGTSLPPLVHQPRLASTTSPVQAPPTVALPAPMAVAAPAAHIDAYVPPVRRVAPSAAAPEVATIKTRRVQVSEIATSPTKPLETSKRSSLGGAVPCAAGTKLDARSLRCKPAASQRKR